MKDWCKRMKNYEKKPFPWTCGTCRQKTVYGTAVDYVGTEYHDRCEYTVKIDGLKTPKCTNCGTFRMPPSPFCFICQTRDVEWVELSGLGTIYTFTVVRHPLHPDLAAICPYVSGVVELDGTQGAGARMLVNIIDCDPDAVRIGDRVQIAWDHVNDEMTTPRFRPLPA